jgi:redox-sensitive bicupin YhaK (pirin superfamily)
MAAGREGLALRAGTEPSRLLIGGGRPIGLQKYWAGPFAMHSRERLRDAQQRYQRGEMGALSASF